MSIERKSNRNKLKNAHKNNKINKAWREYQINKYGIQSWCEKLNNSKNITNKASKATPSTAYYV